MPSVRVKRTYATLAGHPSPSEDHPNLPTPDSVRAVPRSETRTRARSRTIGSIFGGSNAPPLSNATPGGEIGPAPSTVPGSGFSSGQPLPRINTGEEDEGYVPEHEEDEGVAVGSRTSRSWFADSLAQRRRGESGDEEGRTRVRSGTWIPPSSSLSPPPRPLRSASSYSPGQGQGRGSVPSRRGSIPRLSVMVNDNARAGEGPSSAGVGGGGGLALVESPDQLVGSPEGMGMHVRAPYGAIRPEGAISSAISVASHERETRAAELVQNQGDDDIDNYSSDYTTDGSEIDEEEHHLDDVVEHLDVIDPQVAVISHLSNAANSILIPRLPIYSRRPVVTLPTITPTESTVTFDEEGDMEKPKQSFFRRRWNGLVKRKHHGRKRGEYSKTQDELDAHVEHVLERRAKIRRTLRGLGQFLKTPAGIVTAIYGFLVVFWGAAIVLFLLKWINVHNDETQKFWIEISSQVVNALFTVTGVGLIPWRVMDTYRILLIWNYQRADTRLRKKKGLAPLENKDDLPDPDLDPNYTHVLTEKQQRDLRRQQKRFMKSQTWYRPHATDTHKAFPISIALWICLLTDGNSVFQCFLCGTMWGLSRYDRPPWTTGVLIPASFLCGIGAAILIARGGAKTKKTAEVEERLRKALDMDKTKKKGLIDVGEYGGGSEEAHGGGEDGRKKLEVGRLPNGDLPPSATVTTFGGGAGRVP